MDCNTARLMLEFAQPKRAELDPSNRGALEGHLGDCSACALIARQESQLDEQLGQAMRQVDVPDRLRARLLSRLSEERAAAFSRRRSRTLWVALAAAALLLLTIGGWLVYNQATLKPLDLDQIANREIQNRQSPPNREAIQNDFHRRGTDIIAPANLNYAFLAFHGFAELQDRQVPYLLFIRDDETANIHAHAKVYVVSKSQFNLKDLPATYQSPPGYQYKVELDREPSSPFLYVIVHTGDNLDWLRRADSTGD